MQDWKQILSSIYLPEVGSLWTAPNGIWNNSFASNKEKEDCHPTVVGKVNSDNVSCRIIPKRKFDYLNKIPKSYLSYYFLQILISFVANRISEEQQKAGLSFEKCKELVAGIGKDKYFYKEVKGIAYLFNNSLENEYIKNDFEIDSSLKYLSHYRIPELTKHYKPLVSMALEDIFNVAESPIALPKLVKIVFELFDQGEVSLSVLAEKHGLAKSTLHHKTESFKKKIIENYIPDTEDDGINFLQNLSAALNELAK